MGFAFRSRATAKLGRGRIHYGHPPRSACVSQAGAHAARRVVHRRKLLLVLALVSAYAIAEVVGGLLTNSLALLADAAHMLSDAAAISLSLFALWVAGRPPTPGRSFGYYRAEILAAVVNGAALIAVSAYVFLEAWRRLSAPPLVGGLAMMGVAAGGLAVNAVALWILRDSKGESLNVKGAWLHVVGDTLGSVAAIVAGAVIAVTGESRIDALASMLIGLLVVRSSWLLVKESTAVLLEAAPGHLDVDEVRDAIAAVDGVREVHDLHVWRITSGLDCLSCHVVVEGERGASVLSAVHDLLHDRFGLAHCTIQVEPPGFEEKESPV